jgi:dienelactone hydrolase
MSPDTDLVGARLAIAPHRPTLDTELHIVVSDLTARARVTLRAEATDPRGGIWRSSAVFEADDHGVIDLRRDAPVSGGYLDADPMGLIWSMRPDDSRPPASARTPDFLAATPLRLVAEADGMPIASTEIQRLRVPDGLSRTEVREHGLVGTLYRPDTRERLPGVVLLGGAEGGMHEDDAALLAAHGYAALALAYYGLPGLPPTLQGVPVEYFAGAFDHLRARPDVHPDRLAVVGGSKGGEAALLIGSLLPGLRAVISILGSGVVTQGISQDVRTGSFLDILATPVPSWTHRGRELPYLPTVVTPRMRAALAAGDPVALRWAMPDPRHLDATADTIIPVERIDGAVLLISAEDDEGYGMALHKIAADRLAAAGHPQWRHIVHPGAGHQIIAPPYAPTTQSADPGPGVTFRNGGSPASDAAARAATWQELLRFLAHAL